MKNPAAFYQREKETLAQKMAVLKRKSANIRVLRFFVFLSTAFVVYWFFEDLIILCVSAGIGMAVFIGLVLKHIGVQREVKIMEAKITINTTEISVLNGSFSALENGEAFNNANHFYSNDIDLFGEGSFFQYINRTSTLQGKKELAKIVLANTTDAILEKQNAIKELAKKVKFRQQFAALASLDTVKKPVNILANWMVNYTAVLPAVLYKVSLVFSLISLLLFGLTSFSIIPFSIVIAWFFIGLFVSLVFMKKTSKLYAEIEEAAVVFKQYYLLLQEIESENFTTKILKEKQKTIQLEQKKASVIFKEFSKILDAFDNRNNVIVALVGNGLFLMEIKNACKVEQWINTYKHTVEKWFAAVAFFDAQNSLANFNFNHPQYVFPILNDDNHVVLAENLGHPLLNVAKRVDNNFEIKDGHFFIITGANMAGKSTFLRSVSLAMVMANCGLPVCATYFEYTPIKLITSMRTSDNLMEDESYFYSELKRLKRIVDEISSEKYFIILDEILKGTNSKDKAIGSKKFVEKLSKSNSTGIIATHDISLCVLENECATIKNFYFDAEVIEDELYFDYQLKNGICKNMNASFLLKKMQII